MIKHNELKYISIKRTENKTRSIRELIIIMHIRKYNHVILTRQIYSQFRTIYYWKTQCVYVLVKYIPVSFYSSFLPIDLSEAVRDKLEKDALLWSITCSSLILEPHRFFHTFGFRMQNLFLDKVAAQPAGHLCSGVFLFGTECLNVRRLLLLDS